MRKAGRGSLVEVLIPCLFIMWRSSSTVVRSKEDSWYWLEVEEGGERGFAEEGRVERILVTLVRKKLLKDSARSAGSLCEGKERVLLL